MSANYARKLKANRPKHEVPKQQLPEKLSAKRKDFLED